MPARTIQPHLTFDIMQFDSLASTNLFVVENEELHSLPEGTVVLAKQQTAGIGQSGNSWVSEAGKNLTFSLLLRPAFLPASAQFQLHKVLSVAVCKTLQQLLPQRTDIRIKWPNDIYVGNRKICGMLVNNKITGSSYSFAVAGIGLNVNQTYFDPSLPNPVSLKSFAEKDFQLFDVLEQMLSNISIWYNALENHDLKTIDSCYFGNLLNFGKQATYVYQGNEIRATISGVDQFGRLQLDKADGQKLLCDIKEIQYIF